MPTRRIQIRHLHQSQVSGGPGSSARESPKHAQNLNLPLRLRKSPSMLSHGSQLNRKRITPTLASREQNLCILRAKGFGATHPLAALSFPIMSCILIPMPRLPTLTAAQTPVLTEVTATRRWLGPYQRLSTSYESR
jgi:hypothetical protein